ncbi:hypothetical protein [Dactylosporangium cerinum]
MRRLHTVLSLLVAAQVAVQAMALAAFVAGLNRWMQTGGRAGVGNPSRQRSYDDESHGVLDKPLLLSAERWLDWGPALTVQRLTVQVVAPALALALVLVALLLRSRPELARAGVVALGVAVQALPGVPAVAWQAAAFVIVGAAVLPVRPRHWAPALVAAGAAGTALALAAVVGWAHGYLTHGRGGSIWPAMMAQASSTPDVYATFQFLVLPLLAIVAVAVRRDRTALLLLGAVAVDTALVVLGDDSPPSPPRTPC